MFWKRDQPGAPDGKRGSYPRGGPAGRAPGKGRYCLASTSPGRAGGSGPTQGWGQTDSKRHPPKNRPLPPRPPKK